MALTLMSTLTPTPTKAGAVSALRMLVLDEADALLMPLSKCADATHQRSRGHRPGTQSTALAPEAARPGTLSTALAP